MGRSPCCEKAHTNKGAWTKEEDDRLIAYIRAHGEGCWRSLPKSAGLLRCGKSCRLPWNFTDEEDELIIKLHSLLGNKWSLIAARLPGRTDNEIKNYWNTHIRRKLLSRGIDPATHRSVNEPPLETTISFTDVKEEKVKIKDEKIPVQERSPDLNLELRISPPYQDHDESDPFKTEAKISPCFFCNLGLQNTKDCSCSHSGIITNGTSNKNINPGYDFLGLKITGSVDYISSEMKNQDMCMKL
ncbi:hypothetical protein K2173_012440 [Erythroxylum novogranatense]|uniref:Uncharacterized protein n=1 Tax=Erythroxylum novogranatense TaxID=1862640 RepID=A0AAV8TLS1_9ROSI|nr:hypothetical protein K2173_012440 [Erythroxylum novogranatense]